MPVEVFISTGDRTFFDYLIKPLLDSTSHALSRIEFDSRHPLQPGSCIAGTQPVLARWHGVPTLSLQDRM